MHSKLHRQLVGILAREKGCCDARTIAARRAKTIINNLSRGIGPTHVGRMGAKADRRIKNSLKFDLGSGFRLICIKEKPNIHAVFMGDHDRCDAWLNHHIQWKVPVDNFSLDLPKMGSEISPVHPPWIPFSVSSPDGEEDPLLPEISQKDLRRVFAGLCTRRRPTR
ncbi:MAG: hypothetical protein MI747_08125 [Desulfobacterales bacterium]|nr:hypothetical protein [Desulfobacterales bacterium]